MKKLFALILTVSMLFSLAVPMAGAAEWVDGIPTLSMDATPIDENGEFAVTLHMDSEARWLLGGFTTKIVYNAEMVEVDLTKGNYTEVGFDEDYNEITISYGLDCPEALTKGSLMISPADNISYNGETCTAFSISGATGKTPFIINGNAELTIYFKATEAARENGAKLAFVLATDDANNFAMSDKTGNDQLRLPDVGSISTTVSVPVKSAALTGALTTPVKKVEDTSKYTSANPNVDVSVSWSPKLEDGKFAANTAYTATVTVALKDGFVWADDASVTADGGLTFQKDGNVFKATKAFDATEDKWTPTVKTAPTASVTYGDAVSSDVITGGVMEYNGEDVPGSFAWKDVETYGDAGTKKLTAVFTPASGDDYFSVEVPVQVTVARKSVDVTVTVDPAEATYNGSEQKPTSVTVKAGDTVLASSEYTVTYSTEDFTNAGEVTVTVTDAEGGNYAVNTATATYTIQQAPGSLTWNEPATIVYDDGAPVECGSGKDLSYVYTGDGAVTVTWYDENGTVLDGAPTNAGSYQVGVSAAAGSNYKAVEEVKQAFTISKAEQAALTITSPNTVAFGATLPLTVSGGTTARAVTYAVEDGTGAATVSGSTLTPTKVGTVTVTATMAGNGNYEDVAVSKTVTITAKDIANAVITLADGPYIYTGTAIEPTVTTVTVDGLTLTADDYSVAYTNNVNVGTATVTVTAKDGSNFSGTASTTFTIGKKTIAAPTAVEQTYTFTGEEQTFALNGFDEATMTVSGNKQTAVGDHEVTVALKDTDNTQWAENEIANKTFTFTIGKAAALTGVKAELNVYYANTDSQTFGVDRFTGIPENAGSLTVKDVVGALTGDDILADYSSTGFTLKSDVSKDKTASWNVIITSDNYEDITATVTVTTVDIVFTGADQAVTKASQPTYGMTWAELVQVDGSKITATVDSQSVSGSYKLAQSGTPNAGEQSYDILFTSTDGKYTGVKVISGTVTVEPKAIAVTVTPVTVEYGADIPTFEATTEGLVGEDTVAGLNLALTTEATNSSVPSQYAVTGTTNGNPNYNVTINGTNALTITKAALTLTGTPAFANIKANDAKNISAEALLAAVQTDNATLSATYANGTTTLNAVWSLTSGTWNAKGGTYTYTAALTPTDETCFAYTASAPVKVTFTVSTINATLTLENTAVTKAMADLDAAATYADMGLPTEIQVAYDNGVDAATYAVTGWDKTVAEIQAVDATSGDVTLALTPVFEAPAWATLGTVPTFSLTVTAKYPVTVTLSQKPTDITYGDTLTAPAAAQTAIDNGVDEDATFVYTYTGTTASGEAYNSTTAPTAAGTYTVTATLNSATHSGKAEASFTIAKRTAVLEWQNADTRTYDGSASNVTAVVTNLVQGDECAVTVTGGTETKAGTYTATATALGNSNYVLPETVTKTYTIDTVKVTAPAADETAFTYTGEEQTYALTENDAYTISGNKRTNAGEQTVTVALKDKENYEWAEGGTADKTYTFTIAKADRTVSVENASVTLLPNSLTSTIKPSVSEAKDGTATYTYSSNKPGAVTVNNAGLMTAVGNDASVTVTVTANATDNYNAASTNVTVAAYKQAVNGVYSVSPDTLVAEVQGSKIVVSGGKAEGQTVTVTLDLVDGFSAETTDGTITIKHNDTNTVVATYTVDDSSVVDVPADVAISEQPADVTIPAELADNAAANAVKNAATKIENLGAVVAENAVAAVDSLKQNKAEEIAAAITGAFKVDVSVNVAIQPVDVLMEDTTVKALTVDIAPSITFTAKPDIENEGFGSDVELDTKPVTELSSKVKVSVKLVDGFLPTVAKHTHNGKVEWLKVTLEDVEGGKVATWYQDKFSQVQLIEDNRSAVIDFTKADGSVQRETYGPSDIGTALPTDSKAGNTFKGWSINGVTYSGTLTDEMLTAINGAYSATGVFEPIRYIGGGGSSVATYSVKISKDVPVTAKPASASEGDTVTLTVKDGALDGKALSVTDANGKEIKLTKVNDTTYTFVMPAGAVAVSLKDAKPVMNFSDVSTDFWAYDAIQWAYENGYVKGKTEDTYMPAGTVTRQQIWMILARLSGANPASMAEAKAWAVEKGLTDGSNPVGSVTRQQMVTMLYRYSTMQGYAAKPGADLKTFPDAANVAGYAEEAMKWSVANNVVGGTAQGTLNPSGSANRAQFAVILYRFVENVAK